MLEAYYKLQLMPKTTVAKLNDALQQIWSASPQKYTANGVSDFCRLLEACVSVNEGYFEHKM